MKKRIAKKINKNTPLYSPKQLKKAFKQLKRPGLTITGRHHGLAAGKTEELNIEGLNYPHNHYNAKYTIESINRHTITICAGD